MAIDSPCGECGHKHSISDHLAGKRFQCKKCGTAVTVPFPPRASKPAPPPPSLRRAGSSSEPSAAPPASRTGSAGSPGPIGRRKPPEEALAPAPARHASKPRETGEDDPWDDLIEDQGEAIDKPEEEKPTPKKKKKKKASAPSGGGMGGLAIGLIAGGFLVFCVLVAVAIKVVPTLPMFQPGTAEWRVWKHPTQPVQVEMPATPKSMIKDGQQFYAAEVRRRFTCSVGSVSLPPLALGIPPERIADEMMTAIDAGLKPGDKITSRKRIEVQGHLTIELEGRSDGADTVARMIIMPGRLVALEFSFDKTDYPAERARFFDSLKLD